jgi:hypothetical protein
MPPAAADHRYQTQIALLLAAAAVCVAVLGARTSDFAGSASGKWQSSVRVQVKQSALATEDQLYTYGDPVTMATQYETAWIRANEYRREFARHDLTPSQRDSLTALAAAEEMVAHHFRPAASRIGTRIEKGGNGDFNLAKKLSAEQRASQRTVASAQQVRAGGDTQSRRAAFEALLAIPAGLAFLLGSVAQARPQGARFLVRFGAIVLAMTVVAAIAAEIVRFP